MRFPLSAFFPLRINRHPPLMTREFLISLCYTPPIRQ